MKYPKGVMELVERQEQEDEVGCTDPRALFVMQWFLITTILSIICFGGGMLLSVIIW